MLGRENNNWHESNKVEPKQKGIDAILNYKKK